LGSACRRDDNPKQILERALSADIKEMAPLLPFAPYPSIHRLDVVLQSPAALRKTPLTTAKVTVIAVKSGAIMASGLVKLEAGGTARV